MRNSPFGSIGDAIFGEMPIERWCVNNVSNIRSKMDQLTRESGPFQSTVDYALKCPGKNLRGLITLASGMLSPQASAPSNSLLIVAASVELFHEASLMHDDIIDRSLVRRGKPSIASMSTIKNATCTGSFLIGRALFHLATICSQHNLTFDFTPLQALAQAQIIDSLPPASSFNEHQERLLRIIDGKTGSLFLFAARTGSAFLNDHSAFNGQYQDALDAYAVALGRAFQIRDDILDITNSPKLRRPGAIDLMQGRFSWPLLFWAEDSPEWQASVARFLSTQSNIEDALLLRKEILMSGAVEKCRHVMGVELKRAAENAAALPQSIGKQALLHVLNQLSME